MASTASKSYASILKDIEALQAQANALRQKEVGEVVAKIKVAIETYGLTATDLGFRDAPSAVPTSKRKDTARNLSNKAKTIRYRDGSGNEWVGIGKRPRWVQQAIAAGRQLSEFEVK